MRNSTKYYDEHVRSPRAKAFYNSSAWKAARRWHLNAFPLCQLCLLSNRIEVANHVHHQISISTPEGWARRLDQKYLQSLCIGCHNSVTAEAEEAELEIQREKQNKCSY